MSFTEHNNTNKTMNNAFDSTLLRTWKKTKDLLSTKRNYSLPVEYWIKKQEEGQQEDEEKQEVLKESTIELMKSNLPMEIKFEIISFIPTLSKKNYFVELLQQLQKSSLEKKLTNTLTMLQSNEKLWKLFKENIYAIENLLSDYSYDKEVLFIYKEDNLLMTYLKYRVICKEFKMKFEREIVKYFKSYLNFALILNSENVNLENESYYKFQYYLIRALQNEERTLFDERSSNEWKNGLQPITEFTSQPSLFNFGKSDSNYVPSFSFATTTSFPTTNSSSTANEFIHNKNENNYKSFSSFQLQTRNTTVGNNSSMVFNFGTTNTNNNNSSSLFNNLNNSMSTGSTTESVDIVWNERMNKACNEHKELNTVFNDYYKTVPNPLSRFSWLLSPVKFISTDTNVSYSALFKEMLTVTKDVNNTNQLKLTTSFEYRLNTLLSDMSFYNMRIDNIKKLTLNGKTMRMNTIKLIIRIFPNLEHLILLNVNNPLEFFTTVSEKDNLFTKLEKLEFLGTFEDRSHIPYNFYEFLSSLCPKLKYLIWGYHVTNLSTIISIATLPSFISNESTKRPVKLVKFTKTKEEFINNVVSESSKDDNSLMIFLQPMNTITLSEIASYIKEFGIDNLSFVNFIQSFLKEPNSDIIEQFKILNYLIKRHNMPVQFIPFLSIYMLRPTERNEYALYEYLIYLVNKYNYGLLVDTIDEKSNFSMDTVFIFLLLGWKDNFFKLKENLNNNDIIKINEILIESRIYHLLSISINYESLLSEIINYILQTIQELTVKISNKDNDGIKIMRAEEFYHLISLALNNSKFNSLYFLLQLKNYVKDLDHVFEIQNEITKRTLLLDSFEQFYILYQKQQPNIVQQQIYPVLFKLIKLTKRYELQDCNGDTCLHYLIKIFSNQNDMLNFGNCGLLLLKKLFNNITKKGQLYKVLSCQNGYITKLFNTKTFNNNTPLHLCCASKIESDSFYFLKYIIKTLQKKNNNNITEEEVKEIISIKNVNENTPLDILLLNRNDTTNQLYKDSKLFTKIISFFEQKRNK
ncbi:hypothetical protein ABK040_014515 [Willaertia magna]